MDWRPYTGGIDLLRKLPHPVYFEYIKESCETCQLPEGVRIGFLAQQIEPHAPEMLIPANQWGKPELKALDYTVLLMACFNAIKQLDRRIRELERKGG